MSFSQKILDYHFALSPDWKLPQGVEILFPYSEKETREVMQSFYEKYYADAEERVLLLGINPGRHGAGVTGIPFTDPVRLEDPCGIENEFPKRAELSSIFVYEVVQAMGGPGAFYRRFYISSLSPLGFLKEGKNYNYYDEKALQEAVEPYIIRHLRDQIDMGCRREVAFSLGKGKNFAYLKKLNEKHGFFGQVKPLPHPRWVMQYRRKKLAEFVEEYRDKLNFR
jgi:hypothetical protein